VALFEFVTRHSSTIYYRDMGFNDYRIAAITGHKVISSMTAKYGRESIIDLANLR